jgi:hypothetical protein
MKKQLALRDGNDRTRASRLTQWKQRFLRALRRTPNIKVACSAAGVSRQTAYQHRKSDHAFAEAWYDAIEASVDRLEARAFELAEQGDPNLITFLLKCHRPAIYNAPQRSEVALAGGIVFLPAKEPGSE